MGLQWDRAVTKTTHGLRQGSAYMTKGARGRMGTRFERTRIGISPPNYRKVIGSWSPRTIQGAIVYRTR